MQGPNQANKMPGVENKSAEELSLSAELPSKVEVELSRKQIEEALKKRVLEMFKSGAKSIEVEALGPGTYPNGQRRKLGDKFQVYKPIDFSVRWMKLVKK